MPILVPATESGSESSANVQDDDLLRQPQSLPRTEFWKWYSWFRHSLFYPQLKNENLERLLPDPSWNDKVMQRTWNELMAEKALAKLERTETAAMRSEYKPWRILNNYNVFDPMMPPFRKVKFANATVELKYKADRFRKLDEFRGERMLKREELYRAQKSTEAAKFTMSSAPATTSDGGSADKVGNKDAVFQGDSIGNTSAMLDESGRSLSQLNIDSTGDGDKCKASKTFAQDLDSNAGTLGKDSKGSTLLGSNVNQVNQPSSWSTAVTADHACSIVQKDEMKNQLANDQEVMMTSPDELSKHSGVFTPGDDEKDSSNGNQDSRSAGMLTLE